MEFVPIYAIIAGLAGIVVMTVAAAFGEVMGVRIDVPMLLGTIFLRRRGPAAWDLGLLIHLAVGIAAFFGYAAVFDLMNLGPGTAEAVGLGLGILHGILAGVAMGLLPLASRRSETEMAAEGVAYPGFFAIRSGAGGPLIVIGAHILYAFIATTVYTIPATP